MAGAHGLNVGEDVAKRKPSFANATEEVVLVPFVRLALVKPNNVFVGVRVLIPFFFDRLAGDLAATNKDATPIAFKKDSVADRPWSIRIGFFVVAAGDIESDTASVLAFDYMWAVL